MESARCKEHHHDAAKEILARFDTSRNGSIEVEELEQLLMAMNHGIPVSQDELDYFMRVCDTVQDGKLNRDELEFLVVNWRSYRKVRKKIEPVMEKYDVNKDGRLQKHELHSLLVELNGGKPVSDDEVTWVLREADLVGNGVVTKPELDRAINFWYHHVEPNVRSRSCTLL